MTMLSSHIPTLPLFHTQYLRAIKKEFAKAVGGSVYTSQELSGAKEIVALLTSNVDFWRVT
jgi:hypothetical protein